MSQHVDIIDSLWMTEIWKNFKGWISNTLDKLQIIFV